ncbi:MAG: synthase subunit gamma [Burkholderiales bacterium]|jgi:F-type H+-transporting ATPase subunit gamma|nr:synthase subunit gamma [Burkholderiales bacterium]MCE3267854.1 synthase subunit gamma [Burkholderiales bacterium]
MAAGKEIRSKIKSVQNTQKITRAMQMVSTSKMRKTQERMRAARPYANNIRRVMAHLAQVNQASKNIIPFLRNPTRINRAGIIFITSDKGLCGGLNANASKTFFEHIRSLTQANIEVEVCALGQKGLVAANRIKIPVISSAVALGDIAKMEQIIGPLSGMLQRFHDGKLDAVYIVYTHFVNTMKQQATVEQLLPLTERDLQLNNKVPWDYIYEPSEVEVLDELIRRYIESVVYQCLVDNMASEQAARMVAMKAATDNAGSAINNLRLSYNKSRQASITKELAEIVAGSAAV